MNWHVNWHVYGPIALAVAASGLATARSVFVPVDLNAARTWWQSMILFFQLWLTAVAPQGTTGIGGTRASLPLLHKPKMDTKMQLPPAPLPPPPAGGPAGGAAVSVLILFVSGTLFSLAVAGICVVSCVTSHGVEVSAYCKDPIHAAEARCKAEHVAVDCGAPEVLKIVKGILAEVVSGLMSQNYDGILGGIENRLKNDGVADAPSMVACAILESTSKNAMPTQPPMEQTLIQTNAQLYRKAHPCDVKARVQ